MRQAVRNLPPPVAGEGRGGGVRRLARVRARIRQRARRLTGFGLALPALIFVFAFMVYPVASLVILSFQEYAPLRSTATTFVGLANYVWLVGSDLVHQSIWVTVVFTAASVAIEMAIGLAIAVLLAKLVVELRSKPARQRLHSALRNPGDRRRDRLEDAIEPAVRPS